MGPVPCKIPLCPPHQPHGFGPALGQKFLSGYFIVENKYTRKLLNLFVTKVNQNMDWYNQDIYRLTCITLSAFVIIHCVSLTNAYSFENVLKSSKNVCENRIKLGSK